MHKCTRILRNLSRRPGTPLQPAYSVDSWPTHLLITDACPSIYEAGVAANQVVDLGLLRVVRADNRAVNARARHIRMTGESLSNVYTSLFW